MIAYLRRNHGDICRQWFEELEPLAFDSGVLEVRVNNAIQQNYLAKRCVEPFTDAAQEATGALVTVRFVDADHVPAQAPTAAQPVHAGAGAAAGSHDTTADPPRPSVHVDPSAAAEAMGSLEHVRTTRPAPRAIDAGDDHFVLHPDYSFDNFVTGPGNRLAYAAAVAVGKQPGRAYNPLFIHGGVGLGKTHLLQAVCQTVLEAEPNTRICYMSCDVFVNHFMEAVQGGEMNDFRHRYRDVDLLLIDDIHFLATRDRTQEEFFHTFNTLYQANKQIVLSSDAAPNEIPDLEERLVSRFNWGLVAKVEKPCFETRVAILRTKANLRGIDMPDEVASYIAGRLESNIRELEGAVTKVQSIAAMHQADISLDIAREALGDEPIAEAPPQLTIQSIIDAVTVYYGVKLADLQSKRRHRSITVPRQVCMYLARKHCTRYSLEEIGGYFGGRDHTTVMHAIRTTDDRVKLEPDFAAQIDQLDRQLAAHA